MTDLSEVYWYGKIFRWFFAMLDKIIYGLIDFVTDVFEIIAGAEIRAGDVISNFFTKIQLILGIIVLFKIVISLFSGIVDPEGLKDQKKGFGSIIKRVVVVLVMLMLIVPLNIPEEDTEILESNTNNSQETWNKRMNDSGILFGTMAELQSRIIKGDVIKKIVLQNGEINSEESIPLILIKSFVFINLNPGASESKDENNWLCSRDIWENENDENAQANQTIKILNGNVGSDTICTNSGLIDDQTIEELRDKGYSVTETEGNKCVTIPTVTKIMNEMYVETILNSVNYKCDLDKREQETEESKELDPKALSTSAVGALEAASKTIFNDKLGGERYIFVYKFFLSTIAGILCLALLLSLTVDTAVRVFKLLLLRLISPIAILSYIDPKSEKTFNNWLKTLTSTYLDLFIRIAIISFVVLFIKIVPNIKLDLYTSGYSTTTETFARLFLYFGLFIFAKEAPKFITETLGIDSKEGKGLFSGIGKIGKLAAQGLGLGAVGLGTIGSFQANRKASALADEVNGVNPKNPLTKLLNRGKHVAAGIGGAVGGTAGGLKTLAGAKDHYLKNTRKAMQERNANILNNARNGGTFFGAVRSSIGQDILGEDEYSRMEAGWKAREQEIKNEELALKAQQDALKTRKEMNKYKKDIMDEVVSKTVDSPDTKGSYGNITDANYYKFHSAVEAAKTSGVGVSTDANGNKIFTYNNQSIRLDELDLYDNEIRKANEADYYRRAINNNGIDNARIREAYRDGHITQQVYGGATGLKAAYGAEERDIGRLSNTLNENYQILSDQRQQLNDEKQSTEAQRAQSNANRFKK